MESNQNQVKPTRRAPDGAGAIYVVDDNAVLAEFAGAALKQEGYEVRFFTDPKAALRAIAEANPKPAALLTDYDMGSMNGLDLIVSSHAIHPSLKTVLLSGTVADAFVARHPAKVNRFLGKPYRPAELKSIVGELLQP